MKSAYQGNTKDCAVAKALNMPVSFKACYEIAKNIKGKPLTKAIAFLNRVISLKEPVAYKRFDKDVGHRKGNLSSGRFPVKAAAEVLKVLKNAENNAKDKGLQENTLKINHISANKGMVRFRNGRQRRRQMKMTHLEVVVFQDPALEKSAPKKAKTQGTAPEKKKSTPKEDLKKGTAEQKPKKEQNKSTEKSSTDTTAKKDETVAKKDNIQESNNKK
ncbi:MAG: 50S ribosomal protein L22 [Nanobdellota archaeon]